MHLSMNLPIHLPHRSARAREFSFSRSAVVRLLIAFNYFSSFYEISFRLRLWCRALLAQQMFAQSSANCFDITDKRSLRAVVHHVQSSCNWH